MLGLVLLEGEERLHAVFVHFSDECEVVEVALLLLGLLSQNVAVVSMFSFDFSCSGKSESFFGTGISFNLRHFVNYLELYNGVATRATFLFLFLFRRDHDNHSLAFEQRHLLYFAVFLEVVGKAQQEYLTLFLEKDRAAFEEYIGLYLGAFLQEADGMLELEVVVVVVGLRAETNFFHYYFRSLGFDFLLLFLLLIEVFLIIEDFADGGIGLRRDFNEIELEFFSDSAGLLYGVYPRGDVVADQSNLASADVLVDVIGVFGVAVGQAAVALHWARSLWTGSGGKVGFFLHSAELLVN